MKRIGTVAMVAILGIVGCSSSTTLSRRKAKTLIEASSNYNPVHIGLTQEEMKAAQDAKYLTQLTVSSGYNMMTRGPLFTRTYIKVAPDGEKYFSCPCKNPQQFEAGATWGQCPVSTVATVNPHVIEVTGITDLPGEMGGGKLAQYSWNYDFDSLPSDIRGFFKSRQPQAWNARFRLYDDGWRLEGLSQ